MQAIEMAAPAAAWDKEPVYAEHAYQPTKSYGFVATHELLGVFADAGWQVADTQQGVPRHEDRRGFQAHLVRLRNADYPAVEGLEARQAGRPELVVLNSHDRSTSFRAWWGLHRFACANGIIAGSCMGEIRIHHKQSIVNRLGAGIAALMDQLPGMVASVNRMARARMTEAAVTDFVRRAYDMRLKEFGRLRITAMLAPPVCPVRRIEDNGTDVWTVFNRTQEACMRGGIRYSGLAMVKRPGSEDRVPRVVNRISRPLGSVSGQVALNQRLYALAEEYT